jgi:hypothetical protein
MAMSAAWYVLCLFRLLSHNPVSAWRIIGDPGADEEAGWSNMLPHMPRGSMAQTVDDRADMQARPESLPEKRANKLPPGWENYGCVTESYQQRLLQGKAFTAGTQSPLLCMTTCQQLGFSWAGTEYVDEVCLPVPLYLAAHHA